MARIRSLKRRNPSSQLHPTEVDATWTIVRTPTGPYFELTTYGSDQRQSKPKPSQTFQLDRHMAQSLRVALDEVFGFPDSPA